MTKTKTFWVGVASVVGGVILIIKGNTDQGIQLLATGLLSITIRHSIKKGNESEDRK